MSRTIATLILVFVVTSVSSVSAQLNMTIFDCSVSSPNQLKLLIQQRNGGLELIQFSSNGRQRAELMMIEVYKLDHYHRALVDEKSLEFISGGYSILLSDYHSEEFGGG
ncbi:hypothetical protein [Vibrio diabolicus]|uniref:Uncharacterized protein n=1 Tax=Vibrio diabolicus TaxID=50719 RepID=A0ABM6S8M4_9VIBR|nr:hypothetical protein [Vibrio diabolicus]AVH26459.1 hypothetical protein AL468_04160 [Vibrio diabolicus]